MLSSRGRPPLVRRLSIKPSTSQPKYMKNHLSINCICTVTEEAFKKINKGRRSAISILTPPAWAA